MLMSATLTLFPLLGRTPPPWRWPPDVLATSLGTHADQPNQPRRKLMRGVGRAIFAATLLLIAGTVNIVYGIGALDNANIFRNGQRFVFTNLNTMGWVLIILGIIQLAGGFSLINGSTFGRVIAIVGAGLGAIAALFSISGPNPWWSLAVFFLCIYVIHGIFIYGDDAADLSP